MSSLHQISSPSLAVQAEVANNQMFAFVALYILEHAGDR